MRFLFAAFAFSAVAVSAVPAVACSPVEACRRLQFVLPTANEVPRNSELRVSYSTGTRSNSNAQPVLENDAGETVAVTWELARSSMNDLWIGHPTQTLAPSAHYRIRHRFLPCTETDAGASSAGFPCDGLCADASGEVIGEFNTAATTSEQQIEAPVFPSALQRDVEICDNSACCGPYSRCLFRQEMPGIQMGQNFRVTRDGELQGDFGGSGWPTTLTTSVGSTFAWNADLFGAGEYRVSIVDGYGNRSPETPLIIPACDPTGDAGAAAPDASVVSRVDASAPPAASSNADAAVPLDAAASQGKSPFRDDGCALAGTRTDAAWIALALALVWRRRRKVESTARLV